MSKKRSDPVFRQTILDKCNGNCAYCGIELTQYFHIDHFIPKRRYNKSHRDFIKLGYEEELPRGGDEIENLMPCCASCNSCKSDLDIEQFRDRLYDRIYRLNNTCSEYIIAKRFGLVKEIGIRVIFYFETLENV